MWSTPAVWKQCNKMAVLHFFLVNSPLIHILFSLTLWSNLSRHLRFVMFLTSSKLLCPSLPSCYWTSSKLGWPFSHHIFDLLLNGVALSPIIFLTFFQTWFPSLPSCFWPSSKRGSPLSHHVFDLLLNVVALSPIMFLTFF